MKEKSIVSAMTLALSLAGYFLAKHEAKDTVPYVMIGGFLGVIIGEGIVEAIREKDKKE
jgi:ethanolamine transporter EutH